MLDVPLPPPESSLLADGIRPNEVWNNLVEAAFRLRRATERALIWDFLEFGYRKGAGRVSGARPSRARDDSLRRDDDQDDLLRYADFFLKALRATFGKERAMPHNRFRGKPTGIRPARADARDPSRLAAASKPSDERRSWSRIVCGRNLHGFI